nr:cell surface A33 antigen [Misgurnus anguillicaudatus]
MTKWKLIFCSLHLISVMSAAFGLEVKMSQASLEVARGDDVTLTCKFKPKNPENELIIITWMGDDYGTLKKVVIGTHYSYKPLADIGKEYEGKASIETNLNTQQSMLKLKQVSIKESRPIRCYVQIPEDIEGQTSDSTFLLVKVPPSQPICKIGGTPEYGQNISLTCFSEEGSPAPTYKWERYDVKNALRPFPPKTTEKDGVLSLFNASMEMSGFYVCLSSNNVGSAKCNLTLSVVPPSMNLASTIGIIGGCVAGIVLLIIVICCCCRKRKQKQKEMNMGTPEVEFHDVPQLALVEEEYEDKTNENTDERILPKVYTDDELRNHHDDRKGSRDDLSNHYDDRKGSRDNLRDQYDERRGSRDHLKDSYDYRKGSRDDLRDSYDYRKGSRDDLRDSYDYRKGSRDDLRDRYDDHRNRYDERKGSRDDLRDRYDERKGSRDDLRDRYDERKGSRDDLSDRYDRRDLYK